MERQKRWQESERGKRERARKRRCNKKSKAQKPEEESAMQRHPAQAMGVQNRCNLDSRRTSRPRNLHKQLGGAPKNELALAGSSSLSVEFGMIESTFNGSKAMAHVVLTAGQTTHSICQDGSTKSHDKVSQQRQSQDHWK